MRPFLLTLGLFVALAAQAQQPKPSPSDLGFTDTPMLPGMPYHVHDPERFGVADKDTNPIEWSASVGVGGRGVIPSRDDDTFGVGASTTTIPTCGDAPRASPVSSTVWRTRGAR